MRWRITPKFLSSGEHKNKLFVGYETTSKLFFPIDLSKSSKITPNNFRFIILDPTQRTSKSAPRFLPEKQRQERASTPMHRLPQCHLGNPWFECQNIYQMNQYDTPLSPRVFICKTYIKCTQIHKSIQSNKPKSQRENSIHHNKIERGKHHMIQLY